MKYPVDIQWSEEDEAFVADVYDLPGCKTHGSTIEEAAVNAEEAAALWLESAKESGIEIPPASNSAEGASGQLVLRLPRSMHARLRRMSAREGVSLNQLLVALLAQHEAERRINDEQVQEGEALRLDQVVTNGCSV